MKYKIILLSLFLLTHTIKSKCKMSIVESYNLNGFLEPRILNLYLCPSIDNSCCSIYDQFQMYTIWHDKIHPKLNSYYNSIGKKLQILKTLLEESYKINLKKLIFKLDVTEKTRTKMYEKYLFIRKLNLPRILENLIELQKSNKKFMMKLRSSFFCNICDFTSHQYINLPQKSVQIGLSSCEVIAKNTITYSYIMNKKIAKEVMNYIRILVAFSISNSDFPIQIKDYIGSMGAIKTCYNTFMSGNKFTGCFDYCELFKFNANSPFIEGDGNFMNEAIVMLKKFINSHAKNNKRVLSTVKKMSKLYKKINRKLNNKKDTGRILEDAVSDYHITENDLNLLEDPYADNHNPDNDKFIVNKMYTFQKNYEKEKHKGYLNFIKNKLHYLDLNEDFEVNDTNNIFKTNSHEIADLENFKTVSEILGVNILDHLKNNFSGSMENLVIHLKDKSEYKIDFEKLDDSLVKQINEVDNEYVTTFHKDNFLTFVNFGRELNKNAIVNNISSIRKYARKQGYWIK